MSISQNYPIVAPSLSLDFSNTKTLDPRITFSRPTGAVYYDGKSVTKAEENLLLGSNFTNNWVATNATLTPNLAIAPDGTTTAAFVQFNGGGAVCTISNGSFVSTDNTTYAVSFFVKNVSLNFIQFLASGSTQYFCNFNLTSGLESVGTFGTAISQALIENVGNGWLRCKLLITSSTADANSWRIYGADSESVGYSTALTVAGDINVWGAQLEQRDTVTAYTPTTTQPITNYIPTLLSAPADTARFDHDPVTGESLGLLVEEQRTNLLTYSEDFANVVWIKNNSTVTANTIVAPDGTLTASKIVSGNATSATGVQQNFTATAVNHTATYFVKYAGAQFVQILSAGVSGIYANFDIINGTVIAGSYTNATITDVGNGFYRISMTGALLAGVVGTNLWLQNTGTAGRAASYTGDGYSGVYIWGAQVEAGAFPTSYVKTEASQVTRSADSASMTGSNFSDWYRQDEGSFYYEAESVSNVSTAVFAVAKSGTAERLVSYASSSGLQWFLNSAAGGQVNLTAGSFTKNTFGKLSGVYKFNDCAVALNSGSVATDTVAILMSDATTLNIGSEYLNTLAILNGHIKKLSYYPTRLSNLQLQSLTS